MSGTTNVKMSFANDTLFFSSRTTSTSSSLASPSVTASSPFLNCFVIFLPVGNSSSLSSSNLTFCPFFLLSMEVLKFLLSFSWSSTSTSKSQFSILLIVVFTSF